MKIVNAREISAAEWDEVSDASPQAWLFHRSDWMTIEERFVTANNSFALVHRERVVGIQPLYFTEASNGHGGERLLHCGVHRHTGLALVPDLTPAERASARSQAMAHIFALADACDASRIQLNSHNLAPENLSPDRQEIPFWVEHYGFYLGLNFAPMGMLPAPTMATCNADQLVKLDATEEQLFAALDQKCRNAVRQALQKELELDVARSSDAVETYYAIAKLSAERTREALSPIDYYREIWSRLAASGRCAFLFARHRQQPVAALLLLIDKRGASYAAGVSDPSFLSMRVNNYIHWTGMQWAKRQGIGWYRFGPAFPEVPEDWPIRRISEFKTKFGSRSVTVIQGSYFRRPERYLEAARVHLEMLCVPRHRTSAVGPA
jgi:hypothetical protein